MSLASVCWTSFKSTSICDSFDLDYILQKGDLLIQSLSDYRYLGKDDSPQKFFYKYFSINAEFLNNTTGEITAEIYLVILSDGQEIGTGASLIINNYIFGLLSGKLCLFLFDSHRKDEIERTSALGTAVFLKFDSLQSLGKLYNISILLKLPNDSSLRSTIFKRKMHRKQKRHN